MNSHACYEGETLIVGRNILHHGYYSSSGGKSGPVDYAYPVLDDVRLSCFPFSTGSFVPFLGMVFVL